MAQTLSCMSRAQVFPTATYTDIIYPARPIVLVLNNLWNEASDFILKVTAPQGWSGHGLGPAGSALRWSTMPVLQE